MSSSLATTRIGFVGAGRLAQTLAMAFQRSGLMVVCASSRSAPNREAMRARLPELPVVEDAQDVVQSSDLVFLSVSDDAIDPVCTGLRWRAGQAVVHGSGVTEISALQPAADQGAAIGGFHPMQMFANADVALAGLPGCTVGIEAQEPLRARLTELATTIGCHPFVLPAGVRPLYHASAYYVGPFLIALLREATRLWGHLGADEAQALRALLPLLRGTVAAASDAGLAGGMGGCVARGDVGTVARHLQAMGGFDAQMLDLYRHLALRTIPLGLARGTLQPEPARAITRLLTSDGSMNHRTGASSTASAQPTPAT